MVLLLLLLICAWSAYGQDTLVQLTDSDKTDIVQAHNTLRGTVQPSAVNMREMVWSDQLAGLAEDDVRLCASGQHSTSGHGVNTHTTSIQGLDYEAMVQKWFNEGTDYDYYCNKCSPGKNCGHYSQATWAMNRQVGCATAWCPYVAGPAEEDTTILIKCYYQTEADTGAGRPYQIQDGCDVICDKCHEIVDSDCDCKSENTVGANVIPEVDRTGIINLHRLLRGSVIPKAIDMVTLRWDDELARQAQLYAESCMLFHNSAGYGENVQFTRGINLDYNGTITEWYSEGDHYDYYCNHCKSGKNCDQYRQLVLASAKKMGCGQHRCHAVEGLAEQSEMLVFVCLYDHSISSAQRPYKSLDSCSSICKNCPEAEECNACQISSSLFMAEHEDIIENCPEECSYKQCSKRQKQMCRIPEQLGCVTTSCRACMYLNKTTSVDEPQHCDDMVQTCSNPCDNRCIHKWAKCVKQALANQNKPTTSESLTYQCFVPPQQPVCTLLQQ